MIIKEYRIPIEGDSAFHLAYLVLEIEGKYYAFGRTMRSGVGVYEEVKDKLSELITLTDEEILSITMSDYFVSSWEV